jgi:hypothetical protein
MIAHLGSWSGLEVFEAMPGCGGAAGKQGFKAVRPVLVAHEAFVRAHEGLVGMPREPGRVPQRLSGASE